MQTSTGMFFRAAVMLACLIAVPLAALFGTRLPELAKEALGDRWNTICNLLPGSHNDTPAPDSSAEAAPPLAATPNPFPTNAPAPQFAPQWSHNQPGAVPTPTTSSPAMMPPLATAGSAPTNQLPGAIAASYNEPMPAPTMGPPTGVPSALNSGQPATTPMGAPLPLSNNNVAAPSGRAPDRFTQCQRRLQELGAVYYLLETWGDRGELFRFYCKVAVGGNPNFTRYFDAADPDPLTAIGKVIQQIEAWRSGAPGGNVRHAG